MHTSLWFFKGGEELSLGRADIMLSTASSMSNLAKVTVSGERIQVNDVTISIGAMWCCSIMVSFAAATEDAAGLWMQGLYASIHHFRETGVIGNFGRQAFSLTGGRCPRRQSGSSNNRVRKVPGGLMIPALSETLSRARRTGRRCCTVNFDLTIRERRIFVKNFS